jgi:hypothetical protein
MTDGRRVRCSRARFLGAAARDGAGKFEGMAEIGARSV